MAAPSAPQIRSEPSAPGVRSSPRTCLHIPGPPTEAGTGAERVGGAQTTSSRMEVDRGGPAAPARLWPPAEPVICIPAGQDPRLRPIRSRGGNGRSERSERSTDQKRAQRPR
ncbi:hypothetical protein NDU88_007275 [Pleurodeles waltl]|uniref:Uncharacterized protein n=1 Tax=Pleurodeles waltl TaxID=8319 RepID=A0AAV7PKV4_PLEWA|nr:hypothetical protein NDU88_007275 [Pleurodeles waltl]